MSIPYISIIVPLHNERARLRACVEKLIRFGEHNLARRYEIILVENGSSDETYAIARGLQFIYRPVKAFQIPERSKGAAVRFGMLHATGEYRYMADVDLSTPIDELPRFLKRARDGWDVVIASREHVDSDVQTSPSRWLIGRVFALLTRMLTGLEHDDTQCGFKLFTSQAAMDIFSRSQCSSMAFDVEALYLARQLGYHVNELAVPWVNDGASRVRMLVDPPRMLRDIWRIRRIHAPVQQTKKIPA